MPQSLTERYTSINTSSSQLEDRLCPPRPRAHPSILCNEANLDGDKITSDYNQLIYLLKQETVRSPKYIPLLADTHCNLAQHFDILRQFFHACHQESLNTNDTEQAAIHLNQAISKNERSLQHINIPLTLYSKQKDIEETKESLRKFQQTHHSLVTKKMDFELKINLSTDTNSQPLPELDTAAPAASSSPEHANSSFSPLNSARKRFRDMVEENNRINTSSGSSSNGSNISHNASASAFRKRVEINNAIIRSRNNDSNRCDSHLSISSMFNRPDGLSPNLGASSEDGKTLSA